MFDFTEKVAISTGATSTIGKEVVARFAAAGGLPVIADLYYEAAKATAKELGSERVGSSAVAMDVADESSVNTRWPQHSRRFADSIRCWVFIHEALPSPAAQGWAEMMHNIFQARRPPSKRSANRCRERLRENPPTARCYNTAEPARRELDPDRPPK